MISILVLKSYSLIIVEDTFRQQARALESRTRQKGPTVATGQMQTASLSHKP